MKHLDLRQFLIESNKAGYAGGDEKKWIKEIDGSTTINYQDGKWKLHDNFFGGEPYGGRLIVSFKNKPYWIMVYYGWVDKKAVADEVYKVLRNALKMMPDNAPYRGPSEYNDGEYLYLNKWNGDMDSYSGEEVISCSGLQVYKANYMGGLVDIRGGV